MACFMVSAAEALVVTAVEKRVEKKEKVAEETAGEVVAVNHGIPLSRKLNWLKFMLWGGVVLLAFEHMWHGEIVPWFPFLTGVSDSAGLREVLFEMATVGVCMAALTTFVWFIMCKVADVIVRRHDGEAEKSEA